MQIVSNPKVQETIGRYPKAAQKRLSQLRKLILEAASEIEGLDKIEETLKWGEPSYLTKHGSTVRMDWKEKKPDQFVIYFKCTSKLVETFREIHKDSFVFEGNRAIVFKIQQEIPEKALKQCIAMALTYHKAKHLPLLGA